MKKVLLVGNVACGKTTLCQRLNGLEQKYKKTQALEVINTTIDTPGEYLERRSFFSALIITAAEVDVVLFLQDASQERFLYSPGQASAFSVPVIGVVTKTDLADSQEIANARELLELTGASPIFCISSITGDGMDALCEYLQEPLSPRPKP